MKATMEGLVVNNADKIAADNIKKALSVSRSNSTADNIKKALSLSLSIIQLAI